MEILKQHFHVDLHRYSSCIGFKTRPPKQLPPFNNISRAFPPTVWIMTGVTLIVFSMTFKFVHKVTNYKHSGMHFHCFNFLYQVYSLLGYGLSKPYESNLDFLIFTFASFVEPYQLPWFPKPSAGQKTTKIKYKFQSLKF